MMIWSLVARFLYLNSLVTTLELLLSPSGLPVGLAMLPHSQLSLKMVLAT